MNIFFIAIVINRKIPIITAICGQDGRPPMASSLVIPWRFGIAAATSGARRGNTWHLGRSQVA